MTYFQGGDFVELLSAQGKSPAAAWKLQGKISKTFDKSIKGNAFTLDGSSETKMQLPKTSSLGLAQRFVILQLLVPFTRSLSVEICFSDFHKVRRRFVVSSAFRDTAQTALHVQLPLNAVNVPRDQWMNLVFDLQTLSEQHFPDSGYRSMEAVCVSGSCRLKRIFTMKDAPTPSRGPQSVRHADIREIPRQFVFSVAQHGAKGAIPIPTLYFAMESASNLGRIHGVAVTASNTVKSDTSEAKAVHRSETARVRTQAKPQVTAKRALRPTSGLHQHATDTKLRRPQSRPVKVIDTQGESYPHDNEPAFEQVHGTVSSSESAMNKERYVDMPEDDIPRNVSPVQVKKSYEVKKEEIMAPAPTETTIGARDRTFSPSRSTHSTSLSTKDLQAGVLIPTLRQSILGEIQQKLAGLEADDERADERDQELFLRHTSLHSGEWHLQQLRDEDLDEDDNEEDPIQLSRREEDDLVETTSVSPEMNQLSSMTSRYDATNESIFSFSSLAARQSASRLFDLESLLQDEKPFIRMIDNEKNESTQLATQIENVLASVGGDEADDLELTKLLAAKRSARQLTPQTPTICHKKRLSMYNDNEVANKEELGENAEATNDRNDWVMLEKETTEVKNDTIMQDVVNQPAEQKVLDLMGLSIDLTNELSVSIGTEHDNGDDGNYERSVGCASPTSPQTDEIKPKSDHDSTKSHHDDDDDDSSFDFEDLVEDAESNDSERDEDDEKHDQSSVAVTSVTSSSQQKMNSIPARLSKDFDSRLASSPHGNDSQEKRRTPPVPPRRMTSVKSPQINRQNSREKFVHREISIERCQSSELSSSFSSRRLQSLLESTDWTAELKAQMSTLPTSSLHDPPSARRRTYRSPASNSHFQTPSTSSIELVYDPILRCYYDPVANKYYALAE